jgi:hypothetical protein
VLVFAVVGAAAPDHAVDVFIRGEDAARFFEEVREDDAEVADALRVETIELGESSAVSPPN